MQNSGLGSILMLVEVIGFVFIAGLFIAMFLLKRKVKKRSKQTDA
ncbi:MAG: hypothetical protein OEW58_03275 [Gammaproteobacteria bacterium]|nr:hypothetical protein [Gammaproteobacteria bacterium]